MKSFTYTLLAAAGCISQLFAAPSIIGDWTTAYGRYGEDVTFKENGTFERTITIVRGEAANTDKGTKSAGIWTLVDGELTQISGEFTEKNKIKFKNENTFEIPSDLDPDEVLTYERIKPLPAPIKDPAPKAAKATPEKVTEPKIGSPERVAIMDAMRPEVSKKAKKAVIFSGNVSVCGDWAKFSGNVLPKDNKPFAEGVAGLMELDFLAILQKIDGKWVMGYHGFAGDIGAAMDARAKFPNAPKALLPPME